MKAVHNLLSVGVVCASLCASYISPVVAQIETSKEVETRLAVINQAGEVWARDITATTVSPGVKLQGPSLFGGPDDAYVLGTNNAISVVTESGEVDLLQ